MKSNTDKPAALVQIKLEFGSVGFFGETKTGEPEKKPSEQAENQQQTQPTSDDEYMNRTGVTVVRCERLSSSCAMRELLYINRANHALFCYSDDKQARF